MKLPFTVLFNFLMPFYYEKFRYSDGIQTCFPDESPIIPPLPKNK